jgi:hypothetical protein
VHGEELVVRFRREQVELGAGELQSHHQRLDSADDQEDHRGRQVTRADLLVVDGGEPAPQRVWRLPDLLEPLFDLVLGTLPRRCRCRRSRFNLVASNGLRHLVIPRAISAAA